MSEETENAQSYDAAYNSLAEISPPRQDIATQEDGVGEMYGGSLAQRMKNSPKMSDTQVVDSRLFPILQDTIKWLNHLMVARVFPETLNPLRNIIIKHLLQEHEQDISFAEAVSLAEVALTIAIDGEGRMDIIHLFSKIEDNAEEKGNKLA